MFYARNVSSMRTFYVDDLIITILPVGCRQRNTHAMYLVVRVLCLVLNPRILK